MAGKLPLKTGNRIAASIAVGALLLSAVGAAAQQSPDRADDELPARRDTGIEKTMRDAERKRAEDKTDEKTNVSTPEARETLYQTAQCLAKASPAEAGALLKMDFRAPAYRTKMDRLFDNNRSCVKARWIRSNRLLVAGDLAEALLAGGEKKVNIRLAALAPEKVITPRTPTDAAAMCVARSDPNGVGTLFSTKVASPDEAKAAGALAFVLSRCNQTGKTISASPSGLRAMIATATYRLLEGQEG